ncbi:MAG: cytidylate kinase family protein, partial [Lactimicrobium massiliense]
QTERCDGMAEDIRMMKDLQHVEAFEKEYQRPDCIVLDSSYSSMGRMIAMKACEQSGYAYYDAVVLLQLAEETGVTMAEVDAFDERLRKEDIDLKALRHDAAFLRISSAYDLAVQRALAMGPCLIHERAVKERVVSGGYRCVSVMIYACRQADRRQRARHSPLYQGIASDAVLDQKIAEEDNIRKHWHVLHSATVWGNPGTYDLMINVDQPGRQKAVEILARYSGLNGDGRVCVCFL